MSHSEIADLIGKNEYYVRRVERGLEKYTPAEHRKIMEYNKPPIVDDRPECVICGTKFIPNRTAISCSPECAKERKIQTMKKKSNRRQL